MQHINDYEREEAEKRKRNPIDYTVENKIDTQTSIEKTQQFIKEKNYIAAIPDITDKSEDKLTKLTFDNLIIAVNTGYHDAIHLTLFGKNLEELTQAANDDHLTDKEKREASDLLYAIQVQNEDIRDYVSLKSRK